MKTTYISLFLFFRFALAPLNRVEDVPSEQIIPMLINELRPYFSGVFEKPLPFRLGTLGENLQENGKLSMESKDLQKRNKKLILEVDVQFLKFPTLQGKWIVTIENGNEWLILPKNADEEDNFLVAKDPSRNSLRVNLPQKLTVDGLIATVISKLGFKPEDAMLNAKELLKDWLVGTHPSTFQDDINSDGILRTKTVTPPTSSRKYFRWHEYPLFQALEEILENKTQMVNKMLKTDPFKAIMKFIENWALSDKDGDPSLTNVMNDLLKKIDFHVENAEIVEFEIDKIQMLKFTREHGVNFKLKMKTLEVKVELRTPLQNNEKLENNFEFIVDMKNLEIDISADILLQKDFIKPAQENFRANPLDCILHLVDQIYIRKLEVRNCVPTITSTNFHAFEKIYNILTITYWGAIDQIVTAIIQKFAVPDINGYLHGLTENAMCSETMPLSNEIYNIEQFFGNTWFTYWNEIFNSFSPPATCPQEILEHSTSTSEVENIIMEPKYGYTVQELFKTIFKYDIHRFVKKGIHMKKNGIEGGKMIIPVYTNSDFELKKLLPDVTYVNFVFNHIEIVGLDTITKSKINSYEKTKVHLEVEFDELTFRFFGAYEARGEGVNKNREVKRNLIFQYKFNKFSMEVVMDIQIIGEHIDDYGEQMLECLPKFANVVLEKLNVDFAQAFHSFECDPCSKKLRDVRQFYSTPKGKQYISEMATKMHNYFLKEERFMKFFNYMWEHVGQIGCSSMDLEQTNVDFHERIDFGNRVAFYASLGMTMIVIFLLASWRIYFWYFMPATYNDVASTDDIDESSFLLENKNLEKNAKETSCCTWKNNNESFSRGVSSFESENLSETPRASNLEQNDLDHQADDIANLQEKEKDNIQECDGDEIRKNVSINSETPIESKNTIPGHQTTMYSSTWADSTSASHFEISQSKSENKNMKKNDEEIINSILPPQAENTEPVASQDVGVDILNQKQEENENSQEENSRFSEPQKQIENEDEELFNEFRSPSRSTDLATQHIPDSAPKMIQISGRLGKNSTINGTYFLKTNELLHNERIFYHKQDKSKFIYWNTEHNSWVISNVLGKNKCCAYLNEDVLFPNLGEKDWFVYANLEGKVFKDKNLVVKEIKQNVHSDVDVSKRMQENKNSDVENSLSNTENRAITTPQELRTENFGNPSLEPRRQLLNTSVELFNKSRSRSTSSDIANGRILDAFGCNSRSPTFSPSQGSRIAAIREDSKEWNAAVRSEDEKMETFKRRIWTLRRQSLQEDKKLSKNIDQWWREYNVLMLDSSPFFRVLIIFGLILNVAFMFAYHTCYKTNLAINFEAGGDSFDLNPFLSFSMVTELAVIALSGGWLTSSAQFIFSVLWPYTRIYLLFSAWVIPWDVKQRTNLLQWLDILGKWSLVEFFCTCVLSLSFRLVLTSSSDLPVANLYQFYLGLEPTVGTYLAFISFYLSCALNSILLWAHRHPSLDSHRKKKGNAKPLSLYYFSDNTEDDVYKISWWFSLLSIGSLIFVVAGLVLSMTRPLIKVTIDTIFTSHEQKTTRVYSVIDAIMGDNAYLFDGISSLWIMFLVSSFLFPILVVILCCFIWVCPSKKKWQRRIYYFTEVFWSFSGLEVFLVSLGLSLTYVSKFANFVDEQLCARNSTTYNIFDILLSKKKYCFEMETNLEWYPAGFILIIAVICWCCVTRAMMFFLKSILMPSGRKNKILSALKRCGILQKSDDLRKKQN